MCRSFHPERDGIITKNWAPAGQREDQPGRPRRRPGRITASTNAAVMADAASSSRPSWRGRSQEGSVRQLEASAGRTWCLRRTPRPSRDAAGRRLARPDRVVGMHFSTPCRHEVGEIIPALQTTSPRFDLTSNSPRSWGGPGALQGHPSFIATHPHPMIIDSCACTKRRGHRRRPTRHELAQPPHGPLELADFVGLDIVLQSETCCSSTRRRPASTRRISCATGSGRLAGTQDGKASTTTPSAPEAGHTTDGV